MAKGETQFLLLPLIYIMFSKVVCCILCQNASACGKGWICWLMAGSLCQTPCSNHYLTGNNSGILCLYYLAPFLLLNSLLTTFKIHESVDHHHTEQGFFFIYFISSKGETLSRLINHFNPFPCQNSILMH